MSETWITEEEYVAMILHTTSDKAAARNTATWTQLVEEFIRNSNWPGAPVKRLDPGDGSGLHTFRKLDLEPADRKFILARRARLERRKKKEGRA